MSTYTLNDFVFFSMALRASFKISLKQKYSLGHFLVVTAALIPCVYLRNKVVTEHKTCKKVLVLIIYKTM